MKKEIIINADDFGMSEAVNYGVIKGFNEGIVSSTTLMVNLEASQHAADLAKAIPALYVGLHCNLVLGKPCSEPNQIPSLVDEKGEFLGSKEYKTGERLFNYDDAKTEILAQMKRFTELMGYKPTHIEGHSALDKNIGKAFYDIAIQENVHASMFSDADVPELIGYKEVRIDENNLAVLSHGVSVEDFLEDRFNILSTVKKQVTELHFHPGYIDQFVIDNSTLTLPRCKDLATLLDYRTKEWFAKKNIDLINFDQLRSN